MADTKNETRELNDDELIKWIGESVKQLDAAPGVASLVAIFSSYNAKENALVCAHTIQNPESATAALVNEAMLFGRQKEVLGFIRALRAILDTAELNIEHHLSIQTPRN
jgi:hypothetical protein